LAQAFARSVVIGRHCTRPDSSGPLQQNSTSDRRAETALGTLHELADPLRLVVA
jgi:hypothetical protein